MANEKIERAIEERLISLIGESLEEDEIRSEETKLAMIRKLSN